MHHFINYLDSVLGKGYGMLEMKVFLEISKFVHWIAKKTAALPFGFISSAKHLRLHFIPTVITTVNLKHDTVIQMAAIWDCILTLLATSTDNCRVKLLRCTSK